MRPSRLFDSRSDLAELPESTDLVFRYAFWLFVGSIGFSIIGMLLMQFVPLAMVVFGPYMPQLIKTPTWTYMTMLPLMALLLYTPMLGAKRMAFFALWGCVIGGASELMGTTGWLTVGGVELPFGAYDYHESFLGTSKIAGHVPYFIPPSWFAMAIVSYDLARRATGSALGRVLMGTVFMVLWDVSLDPAMNAAWPFWTYGVDGFFYGMPLSNWIGWFVVSLVIIAGFEWIGGGLPQSSVWAPWVYFLNCFFPLSITALQEMTGTASLYGASAFGALATALPFIVIWLAELPDETDAADAVTEGDAPTGDVSTGDVAPAADAEPSRPTPSARRA
jgi:putative membrane protein